MILNIALPLIAGLAILWLTFIVVLLVAKPDTPTLTGALWIVPDATKLIRKLSTDKTLYRDSRTRLRLLAAYLALRIDLIPDFIPVLGNAHDAILIAATLRAVARHSGVTPIRQNWSGTSEGLNALAQLCRLPQLDPTPKASPPDSPQPPTETRA